MLQLSINEKLLNKQSQQYIKRLNRKMERDLAAYPDARLFLQVVSKTKKIHNVKMHVEYSNQTLYAQEFKAKYWEAALGQCVEHAIHSLKTEFPLEPTEPRRTSHRFMTY